MVFFLCGLEQSALAQTVSSVRGFDGGVAPLFSLTGPGSLYLDNLGTQGFLYNPGNAAAVSRRLEGVAINPYSWLSGLPHWRLRQPPN